MDNRMFTYEYDQKMESRKWSEEIPFINFPNDWKIKIIPPFAGAVVRFRIEKNNAAVSVYLDCYDHLGCYGEPYWEIYPYNEDTFRCDMKDTDSLLKAIEETLNNTQ